MNHQLITIGREYGSGGHKIAQLLADRLGIHYFDKELLVLAARRGDLKHTLFEKYDEKAKNPFLYESNYSGNENVVKGESMEETIFELQKAVIKDIAETESAVIVGRCADVILTEAGYKVLSVFISTPFDKRVARIKRIYDIPEKVVISMTEKKDDTRKAYYEKHSGKTWGVPESYDLYYDSSQYENFNEIVEDIVSHLEL